MFPVGVELEEVLVEVGLLVQDDLGQFQLFLGAGGSLGCGCNSCGLRVPGIFCWIPTIILGERGNSSPSSRRDGFPRNIRDGARGPDQQVPDLEAAMGNI